MAKGRTLRLKSLVKAMSSLLMRAVLYIITKSWSWCGERQLSRICSAEGFSVSKDSLSNVGIVPILSLRVEEKGREGAASVLEKQ